ncbi:unnamed protein product [marine sediment metagenome]|uniref:Uncharacterized protein n=1 Tax=marine sediment metagenome TaxID=412755 RepID=X0SLE9_9ZZZZ
MFISEIKQYQDEAGHTLIEFARVTGDRPDGNPRFVANTVVEMMVAGPDGKPQQLKSKLAVPIDARSPVEAFEKWDTVVLPAIEEAKQKIKSQLGVAEGGLVLPPKLGMPRGGLPGPRRAIGLRR